MSTKLIFLIYFEFCNNLNLFELTKNQQINTALNLSAEAGNLTGDNAMSHIIYGAVNNILAKVEIDKSNGGLLATKYLEKAQEHFKRALEKSPGDYIVNSIANLGISLSLLYSGGEENKREAKKLWGRYKSAINSESWDHNFDDLFWDFLVKGKDLNKKSRTEVLPNQLPPTAITFKSCS